MENMIEMTNKTKRMRKAQRRAYIHKVWRFRGFGVVNLASASKIVMSAMEVAGVCMASVAGVDRKSGDVYRMLDASWEPRRCLSDVGC